MTYNELIRKKNNALAITLLISIVIRGIVNAFFLDTILMPIIMIAGGIVVGTILMLLNRKLNPIVMMYLIVIFMTVLCFLLMYEFPCMTNYLMIFMSIFFVVIYEDIRPIILQCILAGACMLWSYNTFYDKLQNTMTTDAISMSLVYIVSGTIAYLFLCKYSKEQLQAVSENARKSAEQQEKAEGLLTEIGKSVDSLDNTSEKISGSINVTREISEQIAQATEAVARSAAEEVDETESIKCQVENSVEQVQEVSEASRDMSDASDQTGLKVQEGGRLVNELKAKMEDLSSQMNAIAQTVEELASSNKEVISILGTLDEITDQTSLLSLNASIEAARAGEAGRGFAVVAEEIRNLSDNSAQFTSQIHEILNGVSSQTQAVQTQIVNGLEAVSVCTENTIAVDETFRDISDNTTNIFEKANEVLGKAAQLDSLLKETLESVSSVSDNIESTSAAMEEVAASVSNLNDNIGTVVDGYQEINSITETLKDTSGEQQIEVGEE